MAAGNTYEAIFTTTISGSSVSDITFSSIPSTYTDIVVIAFIKATNAANTSLGFQVNGDTASNYSNTRLQGNGTTAVSERSSSQTSGQFSGTSFRVADSADNYSPTIFNMMNYANTTTYKTFIARGNNASAGVGTSVSLWQSTAAINSLKIITFAGSIDVGTVVSLYGIKSA